MGSLTLSNMGDKIRYVQFLNDASEIRFRVERDESKNDVILQLPIQKPKSEIPVLEIYLK